MKKFFLILSIITSCVFLAKSAPSGTYRDNSGRGMIKVSHNGKEISMWVDGYSVGGMTIISEEQMNDGKVIMTIQDGDTTYENCYYYYDNNGDVIMKFGKRTFKMVRHNN